MAIDYKKSGRRNGMSDAEFTKAMADAKAFFAQSQDLYKKLEKSYDRVTDNLKEQGTLEGMLNGKRLEAQMMAEAMKRAQEEGRDVTQDELDKILGDDESVDAEDIQRQLDRMNGGGEEGDDETISPELILAGGLGLCGLLLFINFLKG